MYKFQYKISILNFLTCANLHMIEKPHLIYEKRLIPMEKTYKNKNKKTKKTCLFGLYISYQYNIRVLDVFKISEANISKNKKFKHEERYLLLLINFVDTFFFIYYAL